MGRGTGSISAVVFLALVAALVGCGGYAPAAADGGCAQAILGDWADGSIDASYPDDCYLAAIDALPEDLRAYTSAQDDIRRALQSHRRSADAVGEDARTLAEVPAVEHAGVTAADGPPLAVLGLATLVGVICAVGAAAFVVRRLRQERS